MDEEDNCPAADCSRRLPRRSSRSRDAITASNVRRGRSRWISKPRRPRPTRAFGTDATSSRINELIFDSLVKTDRNGQFVGHLAESIERPSPTEIIFHLKHGVRFSDGRELTARDVLFTYDSILAPDSMSPKRAGLEQLKSIDAPDDYTIVMTTARPYAPALELATEGIVPAGTPLPAKQTQPLPSAAAHFGWLITCATRPFGSSAIRIIRIRSAAAQSILLKIVPDPTVQRARTGRRGLRLLGKLYRVRRVAVARARIRFLEVSKTPGTTYKYLSFNFRDPRLRDLRVRRAIAYAIDRNTIVNTMLRGAGRIATGMLSPENWAYDGNVTSYSYDPQKAGELLDEAGYPAAKQRDARASIRIQDHSGRCAHGRSVSGNASASRYRTDYSDARLRYLLC